MKFTSFDQQKSNYDDSNKSSGERKDGRHPFLKLEANKTYKVRLVGVAVEYLQHWKPFICRSPGPETDPLILDYKMIPSPRYSAFVMDRNDGNKIKVMDFPIGVHNAIVSWKDATKQHPGGRDGPDWQIQVILKGSDKKKTKYTATALNVTSFSDAEVEKIKAMKLKEELEKIRADETPERIRERIVEWQNSLGGASKTTAATTSEDPMEEEEAATTTAATVSTATKQKVTQKSNDEDPLF